MLGIRLGTRICKAAKHLTVTACLRASFALVSKADACVADPGYVLKTCWVSSTNEAC